MKNNIFFLLAIMLFAVTSCQPSKQKLRNQVTNMETSLYSNESEGFNQAKADSLINLYLEFTNRFPGDSMAPDYLFKAATILMNLNKSDRSLSCFREFAMSYPDHTKAPLCLFFEGFIQENQLRDLRKARESYQHFIEKYPTHDFADDAQASLDHLGKTPEEMIREFEAKQKEDSLLAAKQE